MSALRPLFAAAGALLLIALVALAVRSGDGPAVPTAGGSVSPGETIVDDPTVSPSDDESTAEPTPDATTPDAAATDGATGADPSAPSDDTACGVACGDDEPTASGGSGDATRPQATDGTGSASEGGATDGSGGDGTDGSDSTGTDGTDGSGSDGSGNDEGDDDGREVVAIGEVDDMPDTGGGALSVVGALVLGAGLGVARRR